MRNMALVNTRLCGAVVVDTTITMWKTMISVMVPKGKIHCCTMSCDVTMTRRKKYMCAVVFRLCSHKAYTALIALEIG